VALRYGRRRVGRPLLAVWDRLNAHRAKPVQAFGAAHAADYQLEWMPAYAPDLHPGELCNGAVKRALQDAAPISVAELHRDARRFIRLSRRPDLLHGFFRHAGLRVTGSS
jgi:hypothetical protein